MMAKLKWKLWLGCAAMTGLASPVSAEAPLATTAAADTNAARALHCMTIAIAYEAGHEPLAGQEAVGEVILNRARNGAYPASVCGVVFQGSARRTGCQFTFTCDGSLRRRMSQDVFAAARASAARVLDGLADNHVNGATHYHANYVSPYWAPSLVRIAKIGAHIFYRAPGAPDVRGRYLATAETVPSLDAQGTWAIAGDAVLASVAARPATTVPITPAQPPPAFAPWGLKTN